MPDTPRCRTCKHWTQHTAEALRWGRGEFDHYCDKLTVSGQDGNGYGFTVPGLVDADLAAADREFGQDGFTLETGPDFFCALHEPNEEEQGA